MHGKDWMDWTLQILLTVWLVQFNILLFQIVFEVTVMGAKRFKNSIQEQKK